jgi:hypothetical protein
MASGTSSASRRRRIVRNSVSLTVAASRAFRMAGSSWPTVNSSTRVPGTRPALAKSSFKLLNRSSRRNWERTTWVPDAPLADQQALLHQFLDRLPGRRSGQAEPAGQRELVLQPFSRARVRRC